MDISEVDLDGGTFKFTIPYHWISWIVWVIGLILTLLGIVATLGGNGIGTLLLSAVGCLMMAFASPGSLEGQMKKVRENAIDPAELSKLRQGLTIDQLALYSNLPMSQQMTLMTGFYLFLNPPHGIMLIHTVSRDGTAIRAPNSRRYSKTSNYDVVYYFSLHHYLLYLLLLALRELWHLMIQIQLFQQWS